jgi:hypothetical protein
MSNLGNAYAVAGALYARDTSLPIGEIADNIYQVVDGLDFGGDESKADLYAQLAENLAADTGFANAVIIINECMDSTQRRHPHG